MRFDQKQPGRLDPSAKLMPEKDSKKMWLEIVTHLLVWLIIFLLPYFARFNYSDRSAGWKFFPLGDIINVDMGLKLIWVVIFYLNAFLLVPFFFSKKKYLLYGIIILVLFCLIILVRDSIMNVLYMPRGTFVRFRTMGTSPGMISERLTELRDTQSALPDSNYGLTAVMPVVPDSGYAVTNVVPALPAISMPMRTTAFSLLGALTFNLAPYALTIAAGILFRMLRDKARADKQAREKQEENLKTELSFLRSQVSPHFLFNVLNNVTALARKKSDELEPTIIKLSSLMRYMLYEANEEKVLLKTEVDYLNSYIELQRQRFGDKVAISVQLENLEQPEARIEPMLLIPFVENAFKHGVGFIQQPRIDISLSAEEGELVFKVNNKCNKDKGELKDTASGIGLANVSRRLNLLYGGAHVLDIRKETDDENNIWFSITLHVKLH